MSECEELVKKQIVKDLFSLINNSTEGRITPKTLAYWESQMLNPSANIVVSVKYFNFPVSASACTLKGDITENAVIVTHREYRGKGYAQEVLNNTLQILKKLGVKYKASVADDNIGSNKVMQRCGLGIKDKKPAKRTANNNRGEDFIQITYGE